MSTDPLKILGMHAGATPVVFENAKMLRSKMTEEETIVWNFLKQKPLEYKFRRQHPFGRYILDFYCHKKRLSIEIDGDYHSQQNQRKYDKERTKYVSNLGIKEVRYQNLQIQNNFEMVKDSIFFLLGSNSL